MFEAFRKINFGRYIKRTVILLILSGIIATILMTLVYCIPDSMLESHVAGAHEIYAKEGIEQHEIKYLSHFYGTKLLPDMDTLRGIIGGDANLSVPEKAMDVNGYARYWHGYLLLLRPLLALFTYGQVRYIMFLAFAILIYVIISELNKAFADYKIGFIFFIALLAVHFAAVPFSMHVGISFYAAFAACIFLLKNYSVCFGDKLFVWEFYLTVGAITSFVDFLTTPLITLGLVLILQLLFYYFDEDKTEKESFALIISASAAWSIGYVIMWAEKWIIGSVILRKNLFLDAISEANGWQTDGFGQSYTLLQTLAKNFACLLPYGDKASELFPFVLISLVIICLILKELWNSRAVFNKRFNKILPFLFVSSYPYLWMAVMCNHSGVHATFWVYRIQMITILSLLCSFRLITFEKNR